MMITLSGDLDLSRRDVIRDMLPSPSTVERLVIDCSAVTSIESVVITLFMRYRRKFAAAGHDPLNMIFIVSPQMRRTFDVTGMSEWFTVINARNRDESPSERARHR
jgi:anti-anti-sigma factor